MPSPSEWHLHRVKVLGSGSNPYLPWKEIAQLHLKTVFLLGLFGNVQVNTERSIRHAMQERLPIVVVINKVGTPHCKPHLLQCMKIVVVLVQKSLNHVKALCFVVMQGWQTNHWAEASTHGCLPQAAAHFGGGQQPHISTLYRCRGISCSGSSTWKCVLCQCYCRLVFHTSIFC